MINDVYSFLINYKRHVIFFFSDVLYSKLRCSNSVTVLHKSSHRTDKKKVSVRKHIDQLKQTKKKITTLNKKMISSFTLHMFFRQQCFAAFDLREDQKLTRRRFKFPRTSCGVILSFTSFLVFVVIMMRKNLF
jgi:hypothetical protein